MKRSAKAGVLLDCAVLIALGIGPDGKRSILGVSVALSEAEVHWRDLLQLAAKRGLHGVLLHGQRRSCRHGPPPAPPSFPPCPGNAASSISNKTPRLMSRAWISAPCCRSHPLRLQLPGPATAQARLKERVAFHAKTAPKLAAWMEENLPQGLAVFALPAAHQRRMRTSNAMERVNQELKRRTRVAGLFPNEASLLRLVPLSSAKSAKNGKPEKSTSTWIPPTCPILDRHFYRIKIAPPVGLSQRLYSDGFYPIA